MRNPALVLVVVLVVGVGAMSACSSSADIAGDAASDSNSTSEPTPTGDSTLAPATFCEAARNWNELTESDEFHQDDATPDETEALTAEWLARTEELDTAAPPEARWATEAFVASVQDQVDLFAQNNFDLEAALTAIENDPIVSGAYESAGSDVYLALQGHDSRDGSPLEGVEECDILLNY